MSTVSLIPFQPRYKPLCVFMVEEKSFHPFAILTRTGVAELEAGSRKVGRGGGGGEEDSALQRCKMAACIHSSTMKEEKRVQ